MKRAPLLLTLALAGCISGKYSHEYVDEPIPTSRLEALKPGVDTLATCLAVLGAPNDIVEQQVEADGRAGMVLVWYWGSDAGWGVSLSAPGSVPGGVNFNRDRSMVPGCALWFGSDWVLQQWRAGAVSDLLGSRERPAFVDG